MIMKTKNVLLGMAAVCGCAFQAIACTGIALTAADGSYVQSRTIEWARGVLQSEYVVIPRGQRLRSFTPSGADGMVFTSKYGVVGLAVVQKEFIAEGINEAGLSAGLFFFPQYGGYEQYDPAQSDRTLADLQLVAWILTQFSTIDQVKAAIASVRVVGLEPSSVVHWRIGEPSGRQVVLEIVGGVPHFYENEVGVLPDSKPCSNVFTCSTISMCPSASSIPKGSVRTSRALRSGLRPSI
jgi:choloylglycine hydrolase